MLLGSLDGLESGVCSREAERRSRGVLWDVVEDLGFLRVEVDGREGHESSEGALGECGEGRHREIWLVVLIEVSEERGDGTRAEWCGRLQRMLFGQDG